MPHQNPSAFEIKDLRTVPPLEITEEERQTARLCSVFSSFSSLSAPVRSGRCVGAEPIFSWKTLPYGSKLRRSRMSAQATARGHGPSILGCASSPVARVGERLLVINAGTVARWNSYRFQRYWAKISQRRHPGRSRVDAEIRRLGGWTTSSIRMARGCVGQLCPGKKSPDRSARGPHSSALEPDPAPSSVRAD